MMSKKTRLELELENEYLLNRLVDIDELALKVSNLSRVFIRGNIQLQMKTYLDNEKDNKCDDKRGLSGFIASSEPPKVQ